jgi:glycine cleavage system aminomethyltransferase T
MVEFAGWDMPLSYEGADKSKCPGGPGALSFPSLSVGRIDGSSNSRGVIDVSMHARKRR